MNVLVVDDDPIVIASCRKVLQPEGIATHCVTSVPEALKALNEREYDLLLVDVKMPEYDGFHLMRLARKGLPLLPMVVMSGFPTQETMSMSAEAGASIFLPKPFTPEELLEAVRRATGSSLAKGGINVAEEGPGHR